MRDYHWKDTTPLFTNNMNCLLERVMADTTIDVDSPQLKKEIKILQIRRMYQKIYGCKQNIKHWQDKMENLKYKIESLENLK